jgi:hypothetical protein
MNNHKPKRNKPLMNIQPRRRGFKRVPGWTCLEPEIKEGLIEIARVEGKSVSWVVAEIINDFFKMGE